MTVNVCSCELRKPHVPLLKFSQERYICILHRKTFQLGVSKWVLGDRSEMMKQLVENGGFSLPAEIVISDDETAILEWYQKENISLKCAKFLNQDLKKTLKAFRLTNSQQKMTFGVRLKTLKSLLVLKKTQGYLLEVA